MTTAPTAGPSQTTEAGPSRVLVYAGRIRSRVLLWCAVRADYAHAQRTGRPWTGCSSRL